MVTFIKPNTQPKKIKNKNTCEDKIQKDTKMLSMVTFIKQKKINKKI